MTDMVIMPGSHYQAICDAVRAKTGDTAALKSGELAAAIESIVGGGSSGLAYDMGEFVLDADSTSFDKIYHRLGEIPGFVLVWTDDYVGMTNPDTVYATSLGFVWLDRIMGLENWFTSSASGAGTTVNFTQSKSGTGMNVVKPTSSTYTLGLEGTASYAKVTAEYFDLVKIGTNSFYRAGTVYKYFVSKAWWNVGGVAGAE